MATGVATLDFGATPADEALILVTGLSGLSVGSHKEAFIQGDDTTVDNDATDHKLLAFAGRLVCEYVSATEMNIICYLQAGLAANTFKVHWATL